MPSPDPERRILARRFQAWLDAGCPHPHDHSPPQTEPPQQQLTLDLNQKSAA